MHIASASGWLLKGRQHVDTFDSFSGCPVVRRAGSALRIPVANCGEAVPPTRSSACQCTDVLAISITLSERKYHVGNNHHHHFNLDADRCGSELESQPKLGVCPEWWTRHNSADPGHLDVPGSRTALISRTDPLSQSETRPMMKWIGTKNLGLLFLGIWLVITGLVPLMQFSFANLGSLLAVLAVAAGTLILLGR